MRYEITTAVEKILNLKKRIKIVQGGTSAGKTIGILEILIDKCQAEDTTGDITSVTSESFPHLKRGAIRDFLSIMQGQGYFEDSRWNKTDYIYTFETGAILEFFSSDQPSKTRGPRRKRLFMNEANNMPFETFEQLEIRTTDEIYIDYNPTNEFWVQLELLNKRNDVDFIILTYKDNEALQQSIVDSIEQRKNRSGWWKVFGLGQLGEVEGKIYKNWAIIDSIPHEARLERYGLDFGYTNDPTAIIALYYYNGGYIIDEVMFAKGMSNKMIADMLVNTPKAIVIADSAEPKSIDEIKTFGISVLPTVKGKDSVRQQIQTVQEQPISITKQSVNVIHEYRNYLWLMDKDGHYVSPNQPEHAFSHSMDAIRYAFGSLVPIIRQREQLRMNTQYDSKPYRNPAV
jgi:phage terminase large subunit